MRTYGLNRLAWAALAMAGLSACSQAAAPLGVSPPAPAGQAGSQAGQALTALPRITVHKTPTCGCCNAWIDHVREAGFAVNVHDMEDLGPVKERLGVPYAKGSCHTAQVEGYVIEGHVPAADIKRLLEEKPDARGLVLPGMPLGSPGMEVPDGRQQPYTVELVHHDGTTEPFAQH
ncbi:MULTISPECIES: DUF411 domain-containing protein [Stenotrophomonas]|uniref:DUF411 domain-containing protein n=1 Tax=Stenotrophomonas TaxID=40323 RepID=UPI001E4596FF|nr:MULTISPECIES: DUF411 domain-containing protein [Stenotrophomonas]